MAKYILFFSFVACVIITVSSCVKDRIQPAVVIVTPPIDTMHHDTTGTGSGGTDTSSGTFTLLDYWNFNSNDTSTLLIPNVSLNSASISYVSASFDDVNPGSAINVRNNDEAGDGLRMRNPFTSITFNVPTTGCSKPVFTFASQRSSSGPTINNIYYTIDGTSFINDSLAAGSISIDTAWTKYSVSFAGIKRADNNAKFAIRLITGNNNTGTSGNDRYDNVTLEAYKK